MKISSMAWRAGAAGLLLVGLAGCGSQSVNTVEPAARSAQPAMLADQRVVTDRSLGKAVRVVGLNTATDAAGFLKVQIEVHNTTASLKRFTYRVQWFDGNGMAIGLPTAASMPQALEGRQTAWIPITAPTVQAKDFRVQFLEPVN